MQLTNPAANKQIAFVSNSVWYIYIHRIDVIEYLIRQGYSILIVAPPDRVPDTLMRQNIEYLPLEYSNKSKNIFDALILYKRLRTIYKTYKPACVFHYAIKANVFGSFAAKSAGVPCVSVIIGIGYSFLKQNWLNLLVRQLYAKALRIPEEVWFMNNEDGAFFLKERLVDINKVHILHGEGINTDYFSLAHFERKAHLPFVFITATRMLYSKGINIVIDAIRILKNQGYNLDYRVAGVPDPEHPDQIPDNILEKWQKEGLISLLPFTEDVRPLLAESDCFLLPSYYNEGLPRCLMEAASMELPIITTRQKGCRETITDGETGFFCKMKDPVDLAEKMQLIMQMPQANREEMGKAGRNLMKLKFSIARIQKEYLRVLQGKQI